MMDDRMNTLDSTEAEIESPPAVRFDEVASANAKPVQPIPIGGVAVWIQRAHERAHYARQMFTGRTKALALVLVGGLAIGTLGGTILVKQQASSTDAPATVEQSVPETTATQDAIEVPLSSEETVALDAAAIALQRASQTSSRSRRRRALPPVQRAPKAYRVGVIK